MARTKDEALAFHNKVWEIDNARQIFEQKLNEGLAMGVQTKISIHTRETDEEEGVYAFVISADYFQKISPERKP